MVVCICLCLLNCPRILYAVLVEAPTYSDISLLCAGALAHGCPLLPVPLPDPRTNMRWFANSGLLLAAGLKLHTQARYVEIGFRFWQTPCARYSLASTQGRWPQGLYSCVCAFAFLIPCRVRLLSSTSELVVRKASLVHMPMPSLAFPAIVNGNMCGCPK